MLLTVYQAHILRILKELFYIKRSQLLWLMRLQFGTDAQHLDRDLRQLRYLGCIATYGEENELVGLPGQPHHTQLLRAVDVMAAVCGETLPEFLRGEEPCTLSFYLRDDRGYRDFKVVPVPFGHEQHICMALKRQYAGFVCTYLFLPESEKQIEHLFTQNTAYFVFPDGKSGWRFLKK